MTKTMTVGEILTTYELLNNFIKKDIPMPGKLSWIISDNQDELQEHVNKFQQKQGQIGQKFINDGKTIKGEDGLETVAPEYMPEYTNMIQEILAIDRSLALELVPVDEFKKLDNLSVLDIKALNFMINKEVE